MRILALPLVLLLLLACACASSPKPDYTWTRSADASEEFARAREACLGEAGGTARSTDSDALAAKAMVGGFLECMKGKGWTMAEKAPR